MYQNSVLHVYVLEHAVSFRFANVDCFTIIARNLVNSVAFLFLREFVFDEIRFCVYRKSSNNSLGAYLPTKIFRVGAYLNGGPVFEIRGNKHYGGGIFEHYQPESMLKNYFSTVTIFSYFEHWGLINLEEL